MKKAATAAKADSAKIEPTDRSMPPPSMTTVRPMTTMRELAELAGRFLQRIEAEETGDGAAEDGDGDDQRNEGNGVVGPALGQDLADDVIGNEIVAPGLKPFAKGHLSFCRIGGSAGRTRPDESGRPRAD